MCTGHEARADRCVQMRTGHEARADRCRCARLADFAAVAAEAQQPLQREVRTGHTRREGDMRECIFSRHQPLAEPL